jgi:hypothetical protein
MNENLYELKWSIFIFRLCTYDANYWISVCGAASFLWSSDPITEQCCGSRMFYLDLRSRSEHFLILDPDPPNIFSSLIPDPTWKLECKLTFFLLLMLSGAKTYLSQKDPGSRKNSSWIWILGVKNTRSHTQIRNNYRVR